MIHRGAVAKAEKIWLSNKEIQAYLGMSQGFIDRLRNEGKLRFYKPFGDKAIFYRKEQIDREIEKGRVN